MTRKLFDHAEVTCDAMWDIIHDILPPGAPRYCCVCEGHQCSEANDERITSGLPPPAANSWCSNIGVGERVKPTR